MAYKKSEYKSDPPIDMNSAYKQHALNAAVEMRFRAKGQSFDTREPSPASLQEMFDPISDICCLHLKSLGYDATNSDQLLGYAKFPYSKYVIHVPHTLASSFPVANDLDVIVSAAEKISRQKELNLLVSGSAALSGDLPAIGDLDFCEYFNRYDGSFINNHEFLKRCEDQDEFVFVKFKWSDQEILFPFEGYDELAENARNAFEQMNGNALATWKLDCVGLTDYSLGQSVLPITKVSIPIDFDSWEVSAAGKSWAFQEALISERDDAPRELTTFATMGAYINWLEAECGAYLKDADKLAKAAKRAYSLASALFMRDRASEIRRALSQPGLMLDIKHSALTEAKSFLRSIDLGDGPLARAVDSEIRVTDVPSDEMLGRERQEIERIVTGFLQEISDEIVKTESRY